MKKLTIISCLLAFTTRALAQDINYDDVPLNITGAYSPLQQRMFSTDSIFLVEDIFTMKMWDQKYRGAGMYETHKNEQTTLDSANTVKLIDITEKYGYPTSYRFKPLLSGFTPHLIFVHSPSQFHEKLRYLVEVEYRGGRMSLYEYTHIMWHLKGRKPGGLKLIKDRELEIIAEHKKNTGQND